MRGLLMAIVSRNAGKQDFLLYQAEIAKSGDQQTRGSGCRGSGDQGIRKDRPDNPIL
jgi:hypothetical protein